jgi:hypothetical protein
MYLYSVGTRLNDARAVADAGPGGPATSGEPAVAGIATRRVYFRHTGVDSHRSEVAWVDTANLQNVHFASQLKCEVVHVAKDRGICLAARRGVLGTYEARLFDTDDFSVISTFPLNGIPSRARVSSDGSLAALTVFVTGHGYATLGFSTQTLLVDANTGKVLADLEEFEVRRDGLVMKEEDFNFWGVTFSPDSKHFYATLSTGVDHYLVRGDVSAGRADVIHANVECPSLSPDARHVAYKRRLKVGNRVFWQLQILDLDTGREIDLAERRSIDDQLEWLDERHVLYSVPSESDKSGPVTDVWVAPIDTRSQPRLYLQNAYSPAAVR